MKQELKQEMKMLADKLNTMSPMDAEWDEIYDRYVTLCDVEQDEYRRENIANLKYYYDEHIAGKKWEDISDEEWEWYSDYHKDVFGYRPRSLTFGEYVPVNLINA